MNEKIMASDSLIIKRIFNLDTNAYAEGHLDLKSKELIGLTCSLFCVVMIAFGITLENVKKLD